MFLCITLEKYISTVLPHKLSTGYLEKMKFIGREVPEGFSEFLCCRLGPRGRPDVSKYTRI